MSKNPGMSNDMQQQNCDNCMTQEVFRECVGDKVVNSSGLLTEEAFAALLAFCEFARNFGPCSVTGQALRLSVSRDVSDDRSSRGGKRELKKKPVKLQIEIGLKDAHLADHAEKVEVGRPSSRGKAENGGSRARFLTQPPANGFDLRARFEKKGRGGQPVFVLYAIRLDSLVARSGAEVETVKALSQFLKNRLSCGGSIDQDVLQFSERTGSLSCDQIILQCRDKDRLEKVLSDLGLRTQFSGG